jgi:spore cortex formation protein SpoVR/YcgB (stage V sporulation)
MLKIPEGTTKLQRIPTNIKKLKVVGRQGALISTFKKAGHLYMAVVNKDYESDMKLYISARSNVTMLTKQLKETALKSSYKIGGGDMLLFKLK